MTEVGEPVVGQETHDGVAERVIEAALAIIDAEGWDAVSFRRLGAELNYAKSSILYYWPTRAALGAALAQLILREYVEAELASGYDPFDLATWKPACLAVAEYTMEKENRVRFASGIDDRDGSVRAYIDSVEHNLGGTEAACDRWASMLTARLRLFVELSATVHTLEERAQLAMASKLFAVDVALMLDGRESLEGYPHDLLDMCQARLDRVGGHPERSSPPR